MLVLQRFLAFIFTLNAMAIASIATSEQIDSVRELQISEHVTSYMRGHNIPGMTVGVSKSDSIRWSRGFGLSDIENKVTAKQETMYQLASVSKAITAVAAMQLYDAGKLDIYAPIQNYCPQFPRKEKTITTWHLLLHTSGIRHYKETEHNNPIFYPNIVATFALFKDDNLVSEPGEKFSYTSYGYNVLGCVLEGASGTNFMDYVTKHVFIPAEMKSARLDSERDIIADRSAGYERQEDGSLKVAGIYDTSITIPGGGLMASANDLLRFGEALFSRKLLSEKTTEIAFNGYLDVLGANASIGPGWGVATYKGKKELLTTGSNPKVSTILWMMPAENLTIAIMGNVTSENFRPLAQELSDIILK